MMRPIKFRAWDKVRNFFIQNVQDSYDGDSLSNPFNCFSEVLIDSYYIVEQYTGLTDKTGKEIYEGDIVHSKVPGLSGLGIVQWNSESACFEINDIRRPTSKRGYRKYSFYPDGVYRIDGNIHENPELLEAENENN